MSRIFFENEYVIVVPSFEDVAPHKHSFCHIFFLGQNEECNEIYVTGSGMLHTMPKREACKLFDKEYLSKLQNINKECTGAFCGYGVAVSDFQNPVIDFNRNNTYIQSEGINQDFGIFDSPDEMLKEHHQELSAIKRFAYRHYGRHMMNRNVSRIRMVSP